MQTTITARERRAQREKWVHQSVWERILLLIVLAYEGLGAVAGGSLLISAPDGRLMDMPVDIMHGFFPDFLVPGILLIGLGVLSLVAFFAILNRRSADWVLAWLALGALAIWFVVEIIVLQELHWLHYMWGMPVVLGALMAIPLIPSREETLRKVLLSFGILSSLLYIAMNIFVPMQWAGYDSASRTISELSAYGAPTRVLWTLPGVLYTFLMTAFGWGVWRSAGRNRPLRIAAGFLIAYSALGFLWPLASMHLRETLAAGGATWTDTMHLVLGVTTEALYLLALGFAAVAFGKAFRFYSIATFVVLFVFGFLTFREVPAVSTDQPTLIGVWERINIGVFLLWVIVLAMTLLRKEPPRVVVDEDEASVLPTEKRKGQLVDV